MNSTKPGSALAVWYDGDCPVCRQEVALYSRIDRERRIDWIDIVGLTDPQLPEGKSRADLLGRFHARKNDGPWQIGVDAFADIWAKLPGLRWGAFLFRTPLIRQAAQLFYLGFLRWQRRHRARRGSAGMGDAQDAPQP